MCIRDRRVIECLTDPDHPCDAGRLLVVTFTNAAAAEMRQRIAEAIESLLEKDPGNTRLQRQQMLLPQAHIDVYKRQKFSKDFLNPLTD